MKTTVMGRKRLVFILPRQIHQVAPPIMIEEMVSAYLPMISKETRIFKLIVENKVRPWLHNIRDLDMELWISIKETFLMQVRADKKIDLGKTEVQGSQEKKGHLVKRLIQTQTTSFTTKKILTSILQFFNKRNQDRKDINLSFSFLNPQIMSPKMNQL